jgi:hypothetical protein
MLGLKIGGRARKSLCDLTKIAHSVAGPTSSTCSASHRRARVVYICFKQPGDILG